MPQINVSQLVSNGLNFAMNFSDSMQIQLINYYTSGTNTSGLYDDQDTFQTVVGSTWTSGLIFPVRGKQGSEESMLIEQGKLSTQDKVLYINGSIALNSSGLLVGVGSPVPTVYTIIPAGDFYYSINGIVMYKKIFLRKTLNGSLY